MPDFYSTDFDYPDFRGIPDFRICLFFIPRSGSNFLANIMRDAGLGFPLEYFSPDHSGREWIKYRTTNGGIFSYKWNANFGLIPKILKPNLTIYIDRDDRTAQAKSYYYARKTGRWDKSYAHRSLPSNYELTGCLLELSRLRENTLKMIEGNVVFCTYELVISDKHSIIKTIKESLHESDRKVY